MDMIQSSSIFSEKVIILSMKRENNGEKFASYSDARSRDGDRARV